MIRGFLSVSLQWSEAIFIFVLTDQLASWCLSSVIWHIPIIFSIELVFFFFFFLETLIFLAFWWKKRKILEHILEWSKPRVWKIRIWCKHGSCSHVRSGEGGEESNFIIYRLIQQYAHITVQKYLYTQVTFRRIGLWRPPPPSGNTTPYFPSIYSYDVWHKQALCWRGREINLCVHDKIDSLK